MITNNEIEVGVYYRTEDYASFIRRIACIIIDGVILFMILFLLGIIYGIFSYYVSFAIYFIFWAILATVYMTYIKASSFKTIGYIMLNLKIVDLRGEKPKLLVMLFRFFFSLFSPFQIIFDCLWLTDDVNRQSIHDKIAGTYVVKDNAKPVGNNKLKVSVYGINGYIFCFKEVLRKVD